MTKKSAVESWQQGAPLMVVEYRSGQAESMSFRDKETGRQREFSKCSHHVEAGSLSIQVSEFLPDGQSVAGWTAPFKKGTIVLFKVKSLTSEKGAWKATGVFEPLVD